MKWTSYKKRAHTCCYSSHLKFKPVIHAPKMGLDLCFINEEERKEPIELNADMRCVITLIK